MRRLFPRKIPRVTCLLLPVIWLALALPGFSREPVVLAQNDQFVDILCETGTVREAPLKINGTVYTQLDIDGCAHAGQPGEPALPSRRIAVGIPLDARPTVEVLSFKTETLRGLMPAPVPRVFTDSVGLDQYVYDPDPASYSRPGLRPPLLASIEGSGFMRNQRVAQVLVSMARFDASRGLVELSLEVRLRVRFNRTGTGGGTGLLEEGFEAAYQSVLTNYEQSRSWRSAPRASLAVPAGGNWIKISTTEEGIYKLSYCALKEAGMPVDIVDPRSFLLLNGGSRPLPESLEVARPDSIEVSIQVEGEEDGRFDPSDYIVFYAVPLTGYSLDAAADSFAYFLNPYAVNNVYWLRWGGESGPRMISVDASPVGLASHEPTAFGARLRLEKEVESPVRSGLRWIWTRLRRDTGETGSSFTTELVAPGATSSDCGLSLAYFVESDTVLNLRLYLNGQILCDQPGPRMSGRYDPPYVAAGTAHNLVAGKNEVKVELAGGSADSLESVLIDFFEVRYTRDLDLRGGRIKFSTDCSPATGRYEYTLRRVPEQPVLLDVTDPFHPIWLSGCRLEGMNAVFQVEVSGTRVFSAATAFLAPVSASLDDPHNLKAGGADYVAICHEDFTPAVSDLVSWRDSHLGKIPDPRATMVGVTDVMDNFSWGVVDPTAIRDFLRWTVTNWTPAPSYCLLVGASTYDYKNNMGLSSPKNFIPPHVEGYVVVSRNAFPEEENFCYDDWFVWLNPGDRYADMFLGRFDAISGQEAGILAARALKYEQEKFLSAWRKRVLCVADDQDTYAGDAQFTRQCETIAGIVPADIDILKVYMAEYPKVGEDKPGARDAMVESLNEGVLSGCFLGHGNIKQLAHEKVFRSPEDVDRLMNDRMVPLFFYGSCSVGLLDRPTASSMGSLTSKGQYGGNLVSLAASRPTYGGPNAVFANALFDNIYNNDSLTTAGEIVYSAKLTPGAARAELYILYGDPGVKIAPPPLECSLEVAPDSLVGLSSVTVRGFVSDPGFEGWATVRVFDSAHMESDTSEEFGSVVDYELPGEPFHWAMEFVRDGRFTHTFRVPKIEARSIREGKDGRVSVYAWNRETDASGAVDSLYVGGNTGPVTDFMGPTIRILHDGQEVQDSVFVRSGSKLTGMVSDESGIYLGNRPDRVLRLVVNGDELNSVHLNDVFNYDQGSDTLGRFVHTLELAAYSDRDSLLFVASDNFLNTSQHSIVVIPVGPDEMKISDVMNYPNPFDRDTYFTFTMNQPGEIEIKVYTIGGRLIKTLSAEFDVSGYHQVYWDGKDEDGDTPANGVYLYKVTASTSGRIQEITASSKTEVIGKLLVVR